MPRFAFLSILFALLLVIPVAAQEATPEPDGPSGNTTTSEVYWLPGTVWGGVAIPGGGPRRRGADGHSNTTWPPRRRRTRRPTCRSGVPSGPTTAAPSTTARSGSDRPRRWAERRTPSGDGPSSRAGHRRPDAC